MLTDDGVSAYSSRRKRDDFERLLDMIETDRLDVVIAQNQERFFRNPTDYARFMVACEMHGLRWLTASEGWTDHSTADGKMQAAVRFAFSLGESERQASGMRRVVCVGTRPAAAGVRSATAFCSA